MSKHIGELWVLYLCRRSAQARHATRHAGRLNQLHSYPSIADILVIDSVLHTEQGMSPVVGRIVLNDWNEVKMGVGDIMLRKLRCPPGPCIYLATHRYKRTVTCNARDDDLLLGRLSRERTATCAVTLCNQHRERWARLLYCFPRSLVTKSP